LSEAYDREPLLQTSSHQYIEATQTKNHLMHPWKHPADHMFHHPDLTEDPSSHLCTQQLTLVLTHISLTDRQCQVPFHQLDSQELASHSSYSLGSILSWTPVPVIQPHYIYRSPCVHLGAYTTWLPNPMVSHA